jgi:hypothetical protein
MLTTTAINLRLFANIPDLRFPNIVWCLDHSQVESGQGPARWCAGTIWCKKLTDVNRVSYAHAKWHWPTNLGRAHQGGMSAGGEAAWLATLPIL